MLGICTHVNKYLDLKYKYKYKYPSFKYEYKYFKHVLEYKYKHQVHISARNSYTYNGRLVESRMFYRLVPFSMPLNDA